MLQICASQTKAARAMLGWSQEQLAQATGLSINTIRNFEMGYIPRGSTTDIIRKALENAGMEFLDSEGIKRRSDDVKIIQGPDSCDMLFEDLLQTIKKRGGEIAAYIETPEMVAQSFGATGFNGQVRLEKLNSLAQVKCLLSTEFKQLLSLSRVKFRMISKQNAGPVSYFIYGDKHALALPEGNDAFRFVIVRSSGLALSCRDHFLTLWDAALPIPTTAAN